ncbi:terpene synthase family protein [Allokutzneria albata]|uniref:Terpene synthase family, metal binding domain n=1 Tax=Allokutzneria albata TaxID=211114 RepID=A0A1G9WL14_ALLAB|nr:hypothetical protein [Allokutzneria albata]SDM85037.1 Terpene synthase family, metal binding domain [Allokutzneria albata]
MSEYRQPEMYRPYPARCNSRVAEAGAHATDWARRTGMLAALWDERDVDELGAATFAAHAHPEVAEPALFLLSEWHIWGFYLAEHFAEHRRTRDIGGAKLFARRVAAFTAAESLTPGNPVERGLADLWSRTTRAMPRELKERLRRNIQGYVDAHVEELFNLCQNRVPDPSSYLATRTRTLGVPWVHDLIRHLVDHELPRQVFETWPMRALLAAFFEATALQRDAWSYQEDGGRGAKINNGVHVYARFLGCSSQRAGEILNNLGTERLRRFENLAITEVPALAVELGLGLADGERLLRHIDHLRQFTAGTHQWIQRPALLTS